MAFLDLRKYRIILCNVELILQSRTFLPQQTLLILIIFTEDFESLIRRLVGNIVLIEPFDYAVQLLDTPLFKHQFLFQNAGLNCLSFHTLAGQSPNKLLFIFSRHFNDLLEIVFRQLCQYYLANMGFPSNRK